MCGNKVVIIEKDRELGKVVAELLEYWGYGTAVLQSGLAAMKLMQSFSPSLIVCGAKLADMTGLDLINALQMAGLVVDTPVILLTNTKQVGVEKSKLPPRFGSLSLPFAVDDLRSLVVQFVGPPCSIDFQTESSV